MTLVDRIIEFPMDTPVSQRTVALHVLGIGGAGSNALCHLSRQSFDGVRFTVLNTDAAALRQSPVETKLMLGSKSTRGLGAGGDPERGRTAAVEDTDQIRAHCQGAGLVFVVAGMGGGTGTGAAPVVARIAKEAGALVMAIVILPFECEGTRRQRQAELGLEELRRAADAVVCLPNQRVFRLIDEKTSLLEAFSITNEFVAQALRAIYRLLSRPGLINVDFADLCTVARGNCESSLATAEARGEGRGREVVQKLMEHPLLENTQTLAEATTVLVSIAGGPGLTMSEVNRIMEQINRQCEQAHIILGAAIDEDLGDSVSVTLLASSPTKPLPAPTRSADSAGQMADEEAISAAISTEPGNRPVVIPAPPRELSKTPATEILTSPGRQRKGGARMRQGQLPLDLVAKGRFEKSEPTIHNGHDLDVPTYIRRGIALN